MTSSITIVRKGDDKGVVNTSKVAVGGFVWLTVDSGSSEDWFDAHAVNYSRCGKLTVCCPSPPCFPCSRKHHLPSIKTSRVRINLSHRKTHTPAPVGRQNEQEANDGTGGDGMTVEVKR